VSTPAAVQPVRRRCFARIGHGRIGHAAPQTAMFLGIYCSMSASATARVTEPTAKGIVARGRWGDLGNALQQSRPVCLRCRPLRRRQRSTSAVCSLFVSIAVAQHGEGDSPTPEGLIGQTDPALSLCGDREFVVQVLKMLFDGCLCDE